MSSPFRAEITEELFNAILPLDQRDQCVSRVVVTELASRHYYYVHGVSVLRLVNHLGSIEQYFIVDINA